MLLIDAALSGGRDGLQPPEGRRSVVLLEDVVPRRASRLIRQETAKDVEEERSAGDAASTAQVLLREGQKHLQDAVADGRDEKSREACRDRAKRCIQAALDDPGITAERETRARHTLALALFASGHAHFQSFNEAQQQCGQAAYALCERARDDLQQALAEMTGQRTVPNVWVKGKHIGGCDDTFKAHFDGSLEDLLDA